MNLDLGRIMFMDKGGCEHVTLDTDFRKNVSSVCHWSGRRG